MNIETLTGFALEKALASRLRELLGRIPWLRAWRVEHVVGKAEADLIATVPLAGKSVMLTVECKSELRPSGFDALANKRIIPSGRAKAVVPVLAMPFVSPRLADLCVEHGWSWYDLAGNYHLDVPGAIYLERRGLERLHRPPRPKANLGTPEAGRVIRALLTPQPWGPRWTQRKMGAHFGQLKAPIPGPSLGLINKVIQHLRDEAFIEVLKEGGFRVRDPLKLLFAWREAYRFDRHERRAYFTLLPADRMRNALARLALEAGGFAAYAAFSAADFQAPHVRQPKTWIYVRRDYVTRFEALTEAKPVDSGENVVVLIPDDDGVFYLGEAGNDRMASTNPVQTYVDLYHCGGRGAEAAEALLEQKLKPEWKSHGLP